MANSIFNSAKKRSRFAQVGKYVNALINTGTIKRVWGSKPIWAQLKITERCNLNCGYCSEHRNNGTNVPKKTIYGWMEHCRKLGVRHIDFIGGEPLIHPDLFELISKARELKMNTGLTTNGFLMNEEKARQLIASGISRLQFSIDCVDPNSITKKALSLLTPQLDLMQRMNIWVHVNSVLTESTIMQAYDLARKLFAMGIPVAFSPVHDQGELLIDSENVEMVNFLKWLTNEKIKGMPVNMPQFLIDYFIDKFSGMKINWTCQGGCKAFYVDEKGFFKTCSHKTSCQSIYDVDSKTLRNNRYEKKGCEDSCGVSCMIVSSFPFTKLGYVVRSGIAPRHSYSTQQKGMHLVC